MLLFVVSSPNMIDEMYECFNFVERFVFANRSLPMTFVDIGLIDRLLNWNMKNSI